MPQVMPRLRPKPPLIVPRNFSDNAFRAGVVIISTVIAVGVLLAAAAVIQAGIVSIWWLLPAGIFGALALGFLSVFHTTGGPRADQRGVFVPEGIRGWVLYSTEEIDRIEWEVLTYDDDHRGWQLNLGVRTGGKPMRLNCELVKSEDIGRAHATRLGHVLSVPVTRVRTPR